MRLSDIAIAPLDLVRAAREYVSDLAVPTLRLGVTGLARAGKTVFISALVRNLTEGGRLPFLAAYAEGRVLRAYLEPQPDDDVPRFDYERHLSCLTAPEPVWPESTRAISELRLTIEYLPVSTLARALGPRKLHIDIVDYPGEWLLDLAMLGQSYAEWSAEALQIARHPARGTVARPWLEHVSAIAADAPADEQVALAAARAFTDYLAAARAHDPALSTVGPGRFLLPGDLAGSPLLTFAPLPLAPDAGIARGSLAAMMARRYESYRAKVVRPFFRDHFSRLDRQIVLVDALTALNHGGHAIEDLSRALSASLMAFRPGGLSWLASLFTTRIDRIVFAATKADHLPQTSHDRLEAVLKLIVETAARRAETAGADIKVMAMAALRATTEAEARRGKDVLHCIKGVPLAGERLGTRTFDGRTEVAVFPGDLDADPRAVIAGVPREGAEAGALGHDINVVRFRPPRLAPRAQTIEPLPWPHVRLDRALEHLLGDRLS